MAAYEWWDEVNRAALNRYPALLYEWLPGGRVVGNYYHAASLQGGRGDSLRVNLRTGVWKDHATGEKGGGNAISLYGRRAGISYKEAGPEVARAIGMPEPPRRQSSQPRSKAITPIPNDAPYGQDGHPVAPARLTEAGAQPKYWFAYCNSDGAILQWRVRFELSDGRKSAILPLTYREDASGGCSWRWLDLDAPRPLYGLDLLTAMPGSPVVVLEGELKCDVAREVCPEFCWLSWPGGVNRVNTTDWTPLVAHDGPILVWPDNDDEGRKAALEVVRHLPPAKVKLIGLDPAWPPKWDVHDLIKAGWDGTRIRAWIEEHRIEPPALPEKPAEKRRYEFDLTNKDLGEWQAEAWRIITALNAEEPRIFASLGGLSTVTKDPFGYGRIRHLTAASLRALLSSEVAFTHLTSHGPEAQIPPEELAISLLAHPLDEILVLDRLVRIPVFVGNGRLLTEPGYDAQSQVYYFPDPEFHGLTANENPSEADLQAALELIDDLIADFPFCSESDKAHALALMLLPLVRPMIAGPTPLYRVEAPTPGTGKTLLADILLLPAVRDVKLMPELDEEAEWKKTISGLLLDGAEAIIIDNCRELRAATLANIITAPGGLWTCRILGSKDTPTFKVNCVWAATLNNPTLSREMSRRSVRIRIDAGVERPEDRRDFRHASLREYVAANRRALIEALITICAYGLKHSEAGAETPLLGSFEAWSRVMGGILNAVGYDAFLARDTEDDADAETSTLAAFVQGWREVFGRAWVHTDVLLELAEKAEVNLKGSAPHAREVSLAMMLRGWRNQIICGAKIKRERVSNRVSYRLEYAGNSEPEQSSNSDPPVGETNDLPF